MSNKLRRFYEAEDDANVEPADAFGGGDTLTGTGGDGEDDLAVYNIAELRDGLTLEILQEQHSWIFNCEFKDAVLGLDENGRVVWYDGEFISGEWLGAEPAPSISGGVGDDGGEADPTDSPEYTQDCVRYGRKFADFRYRVESKFGLSVDLSGKSSIIRGDVVQLGKFKKSFESVMGHGACKFVGSSIYVPLHKFI